MTPRSVSLLMGAVLVCLLLFAAFVWPTLYRYETSTYRTVPPEGAIEMRTNRLTGRTEFRFPRDRRWVHDPFQSF